MMIFDILKQLNPYQHAAFYNAFQPNLSFYDVKNMKFEIAKIRSIVMSSNVPIREADIIARVLKVMDGNNIFYGIYSYTDYEEFKKVCKIGAYETSPYTHDRFDNVCIYGRSADFFYKSYNDVLEWKPGEKTIIAVIERRAVEEIVFTPPFYPESGYQFKRRDVLLEETKTVETHYTLRIFSNVNNYDVFQGEGI